MASAASATVTVNVVDERVPVAMEILRESNRLDFYDLRDEARKFLLATMKEWNGATVDSEVTVSIKGDEKLTRWISGERQGGLCPSLEDAAAVVAVLEDALHNARMMI